MLFNSILPEDYPFVNEPMDKKKVSKLIANIYNKYGVERAAKFLDDLKELGFNLATKAAVSIGIEDLQIPKVKKDILLQAFEQTDEIAYPLPLRWEVLVLCNKLPISYLGRAWLWAFRGLVKVCSVWKA